MDEVYAPFSSNFLIYINDAIIFSKDEEQHKKHIRLFQELTYKHGLFLSEFKMKLKLEEVNFLGLKDKG